jgi:hypothetical protein
LTRSTAIRSQAASPWTGRGAPTTGSLAALAMTTDQLIR